jgi:hypothetical protein
VIAHHRNGFDLVRRQPVAPKPRPKYQRSSSSLTSTVSDENSTETASSTTSTIAAGNHCPLRDIATAPIAASARQSDIARVPRCVWRYGMAITLLPGNNDGRPEPFPADDSVIATRNPQRRSGVSRLSQASAKLATDAAKAGVLRGDNRV